MRFQLVMYSLSAQVTLLLLLFFSTLGAFTIESHHKNENVVKIIKLD